MHQKSVQTLQTAQTNALSLSSSMSSSVHVAWKTRQHSEHSSTEPGRWQS